MPNETTDTGVAAQPLRASTAADRHTGLKLNEAQDVPLLTLIRNSTFISYDQLMRCALGLHLGTRDSIKWRTARFAKSGLVDKYPAILPYVGAVYTISRYGLSVLESLGSGLVSITSETEHLVDKVQAAHFLELNEIRLVLMDSGLLTGWRGDREVRSLNYTLERPFAKDYDAIVRLGDAASPVTIGLEYERTIKTSPDRYRTIAESLKGEKQLDMVLYLTAVNDVIWKLAPLLVCDPLPICFTAASTFRKAGLAAPVVFVSEGRLGKIPLTDFMAAIKRQ